MLSNYMEHYDWNLYTNHNLKKKKVAPLNLPHRYIPRPYQAELIEAFFDMLEGKNEYRNFGLEWCRRAGKDTTFFQLIVAASCSVVGDYAYMLPTNGQAKKVILNGTVQDSYGQTCKMLDFIPPMMLKSINFSEGIIRLHNGSNIYVMGSNNYDTSVGTNMKGCVFSEWSLCDPKSYDYFRPMLEETHRQDKRAGWSLFCWTPRGRNHAFDTRNTASMEINKDFWYFSSLNILQLVDNNHKPLYTQKDIDRMISTGSDPDLIQQEMFLDYNAIVKGIIYTKEMSQAREEGRVRQVPIDRSKPVYTYWDIGVNDATTIWFMQEGDKIPNKPHTLNLINYYENNNEGVEHYLTYLQEFAQTHNIKYGRLLLPHDGNNKEWIAGVKRSDYLREKGFDVYCVPRTNDVEAAIRQTKNLFNRFVFDEERCKAGINCLDSYRRKQSRTGDLGSPLHDWSSNGADSLRQLGQYYEDEFVNKYLSAEYQEQYDVMDRMNTDEYNQEFGEELYDWD